MTKILAEGMLYLVLSFNPWQMMDSVSRP